MRSPTLFPSPLHPSRYTFQSTGSLRSPTYKNDGFITLVLFQSTGSLRSPTAATAAGGKFKIDFNPQAPCGARRIRRSDKSKSLDISIHRLLAEPDIPGSFLYLCPKYFNPQAPCGARHSQRRYTKCCITFQSTGSLRSPTHTTLEYLKSHQHFNPQAPCGARHKDCKDANEILQFQSTGSLRSPTASRK